MAREIGYPVLLKAAAGGGGKGMRRVNAESELAAAIRDASSEAERAFQNGEVYIEKLIEKPRHIEIQIAGDRHGNLVHLGERECSLQRRYQKIMEECPSPLVAKRPEMRAAMGEAALKVARAAEVRQPGDGGVSRGPAREFLFPGSEHAPASGASGDGVGYRDTTWFSCSCRLPPARRCPSPRTMSRGAGGPWNAVFAAEDPDNQFLPSPGQNRATAGTQRAGRAAGFRRLSRVDRSV